MVVGQSLGGPWTYIAPAAGFGIGLVGDMKFMKGMHGKKDHQNTEIPANKDTDPVRGLEVNESKAPHQAPNMGES
jgi:hypothetical protein